MKMSYLSHVVLLLLQENEKNFCIIIVFKKADHLPVVLIYTSIKNTHMENTTSNKTKVLRKVWIWLFG